MSCSSPSKAPSHWRFRRVIRVFRAPRPTSSAPSAVIDVLSTHCATQLTRR